MSLADAIAELAAQPAATRRHCSVMVACLNHPDDADVIKTAIGNTMVRASDLARVFNGSGVDISQGVITRHRRGDCIACQNAAAAS